MSERFESILFRRPAGTLETEAPEFFADLHLDEVVAELTAGREEYDLAPFFFTPLHDVDSVAYRHEVFRDLAAADVRGAVRGFCTQMQRVRAYVSLSRSQRYRYEQERWLLDAAVAYCAAVETLAAALDPPQLGSRGLRGLRAYLRSYTASEPFVALAHTARSTLEGLAGVAYAVRIKGGRVTVAAYGDEPDYGAEVEQTFSRFRQGAVESHLVTIRDSGSMDHVDAQIVELVARLFPAAFGALDAFCDRHGDFLDPTLARFDREAQFYLAYLELTDRLRTAGLSFCHPRVSARSKEVAAEGAFDLALALKLAAEGRTVVCNDFALQAPERIIVVTGPNNGGKTTFARMFGELHHLASLGLPVPARTARLFLPDRVFTHFEREEDIETLRGKLEDELFRMHELLERATSESVLVLNESFGSTTLDDTLLLGTEIMQRILDRGCLGVYVTFVDELASLGEQTVSMVSQVVPDDPARRTFEIVRQPADGLAYAWAIAEKYALTYLKLRERITS